MLIVVDVNVVLSALLSKGNSLNVFVLNYILNKVEFIAPEFLTLELEKHKEEIRKRIKIPENEFEEDIDFILSQITFIPKSEFKEFIPKAIEMLKNHEKDKQYLALALKFNCNIFSGDKILKQLAPDKVLNPKEILNKIYSVD